MNQFSHRSTYDDLAVFTVLFESAVKLRNVEKMLLDGRLHKRMGNPKRFNSCVRMAMRASRRLAMACKRLTAGTGGVHGSGFMARQKPAIMPASTESFLVRTSSLWAKPFMRAGFVSDSPQLGAW